MLFVDMLGEAGLLQQKFCKHT